MCISLGATEDVHEKQVQIFSLEIACGYWKANLLCIIVGQMQTCMIGKLAHL